MSPETEPAPSRNRFDVVIIGAGIAGSSLAYFLTERGVTSILLLDRETQPGYHATGRSAAVLFELDPIPTLQSLKIASAGFLRAPPAGFAAYPVLEQSGILVLFREPLWSLFREAAAGFEATGLRIVLMTPAEAAGRVPALSETCCDGAALLPEDGHLDVHALLSSYLGHAKRRGATQRLTTTVRGIRVEGGRCRGVETDAGSFDADWVVNAAGAWAGDIGEAAGTSMRLVPHRRTIVTFAVTGEFDVRGWPLTASESHQLYFGPESGGLLLSPMDEEPMQACDAHPEERVVAEAIERLGTVAPRLVPKTIKRAWAGLRTFTPDRVPVVGEDPRLPGFFWLAGQGGCGIETSPIMGQIAADLLVAGTTSCFDATLLDPARFARA
jgi:D-arginine dehydrogenase